MAAITSLRIQDQYVSDRCSLYNADSCEAIQRIPSNSMGLSVYSPPFAALYVYSDSPRDLGNCADEAEFFKHYKFLIPEIYRITKPGRLSVVHCSDIPKFKFKDGVVGLKDFPGDIIRAHEEAGWVFHSRVTIWKDPVVEMTRTKSIRLLYKQLRKDACQSGQGMADYLLAFRKITDDPFDPVTHTFESFPLDRWQQWASPVWPDDSDRFTLEPYSVWKDINQTDVLNAKLARGEKEEKHLCPLQLPVIERVIRMWTNPVDTIFSPFGGIGSEPYMALKLGRRAVAIELKAEYYKYMARYCQQVEQDAEQATLELQPGTEWSGSLEEEEVPEEAKS